jgi:mRNA interferase RelE/StbE
VKTVRYPLDVVKWLKRHGNMAQRLRAAMAEYAADPAAHANNVRALKGSPASRMRVGDFRIVFVETDTEVTVIKIGPRGEVYEERT